jgi:hypothetical protein
MIEIWNRDARSDIVRASQTLFSSVGHCSVRLDFIRLGVSGKSLKNQLSRIGFKLCRYVLGHQRN